MRDEAADLSVFGGSRGLLHAVDLLELVAYALHPNLLLQRADLVLALLIFCQLCECGLALHPHLLWATGRQFLHTDVDCVSGYLRQCRQCHKNVLDFTINSSQLCTEVFPSICLTTDHSHIAAKQYREGVAF